MPRPRRSHLGRRTRQANDMQAIRSQQTPAENVQQNEQMRIQASQRRQNITEEQREVQNELNRDRVRLTRATAHATNRLTFLRLAFQYDPTADYNSHNNITIGNMDKVCTHCKALKYKNEAPGLCCVNGKVKLPELNQPLEPLLTLVSGTTPQSKHFLLNIRKYNASFVMTSFAADKIITDHFMPTFKVQGQIYHRAGSLLPVPNGEQISSNILFGQF